MKKIIFFTLLTIIPTIFLQSQNLDKQLVQAAYDGNENLVIQLLNKGANVNAIDDKGYTAIIYACAYGYEGIVKALLNKNAIVNNKYHEVYPIYAATRNNNTKIIQMLLDEGAKINMKDNQGYTALMIAAQEGYPQTAEFLLKKGANINFETNQGHTALSIAIQNDKKDVIEVLLRYNPKKNGYSNKIHDPYNTAKSLNKQQALKELKKYGIQKSKSWKPQLGHISAHAGLNITPFEFMTNYEIGIRENTYNIDLLFGFTHNNDSTLTKMQSNAQTYTAVNGIYSTLNKNINLFSIKNTKIGVALGATYAGYKGWNRTISQNITQDLLIANGGIYLEGNVIVLKLNYYRILSPKSVFYNSKINATVGIKIFRFSKSKYVYADKTLKDI